DAREAAGGVADIDQQTLAVQRDADLLVVPGQPRLAAVGRVTLEIDRDGQFVGVLELRQPAELGPVAVAIQPQDRSVGGGDDLGVVAQRLGAGERGEVEHVVVGRGQVDAAAVRAATGATIRAATGATIRAAAGATIRAAAGATIRAATRAATRAAAAAGGRAADTGIVDDHGRRQVGAGIGGQRAGDLLQVGQLAIGERQVDEELA